MTRGEQVVFVLGMHRSGTSALAGLLGLLGFDLGRNLLPADPQVNARGYWENADLVGVHERVLNCLGSSWSDDRDLPEKWWAMPEIAAFHAEIEAVIEREFAEGTPWAIKDPRLCRVLPIWRQVIERRGASASCVAILRDPREVGKSLATRDGIAPERAALLWLQHFVESERWSRDFPRLVVSYDELLDDWNSVVARLGMTLKLNVLVTPANATAIDGFLSNELRHHRLLPRPSGPLEELALLAYERCIESNGERFPEVAQLARQAIDEHLKFVDQWSWEIQQLRSEATQLKGQRARADRMAAEVDRLKNSVSWRITAPLRVAWNLSRAVFRKTPAA